MITDPKFAPQRTDLPFLKRRVRPKKQAPPQPAQAPRTTRPADSDTIDYTRRDRTPPAQSTQPAQPAPPSRSVPPVRPAAPARPAAKAAEPTIDYARHGDGAASSGPAAPPAPAASPAPAAPSGGGMLDLSGPATPPPAPPASTPAARPAATQPATAAPPRPRTPQPPAPQPAWLERHVVRVRGREQRIMNVQHPTVTLSRVQSGIGQLTIEAVCSPDIGDLRLGAVYQLRSGGSGVVAHADGNRFGPSSRRPVLVGSREEYERLGVDLRQTGDVERLALFAYSQSRTDLTWGGTLVVALEGGGRLELPLERLYPGRIAVLATIYNMDGELIVRAELETIAGDVREAARAYGFDRITWRDDRHPVD